MKKTLRSSIVLSVVLFAVLAVFSFISTKNNFLLFSAKVTWSLLVAIFGFCIYRTGAISKYRSILFILIAFFFFLGFKIFNLFSSQNPLPPYCHIAQAPTLLNFIYSQFLAVTSGEWRVWGVLTLGFIWLLIIFTIGQGICSWVCFYGGIDEACSKIAKKPLVKLKVSRLWRDFPIAFLIFLLSVSFLQGLPVFCNWFCPFKMTETFGDSDAVIRIIQGGLFWLVLIGFVIVLPILTKKRTFCALVCPFGALASIGGKASPYKVTINQEKCVLCGKCQELCPVLAIEDKKSKEYKITEFCNRCGVCIDACPAKAIKILSRHSGQEVDTRDIFIFLALLVTGVISGTFVPRVILQLMGVK